MTDFEDVRTFLRRDAVTEDDRNATEQWEPLRSRLALRPRRRFHTAAVRIAAGIVVVAGLGAGAWNATRHAGNSGATADLESVFRSARGSLRPAEVRALTDGIDIIDRAIADTKSAAAADPSNEMLTAYLDRLEQRRISALREAAAMAYARSAIAGS